VRKLKGIVWGVLALFSFLGSSGNIAWALTLEVHLKPTVEIQGERITLGGIATISYPDTRWEERIRQIDLGYLPPYGETRTIHPREIYTRVVAQNIPDLDYIYFQGAPVCQVMVGGKKVDLATLRTLLVTALEEKFPQAEKIEVDIVRPQKELIVPEEMPLAVTFPTSLKPWGTGNATLGKEISVTFTLRVYRGVVRATRDLFPGETIVPQDVLLQVEVLSGENEKSSSTLEEVVGKKVQKRVRAGEVVGSSALGKEKLIERGDLVTIVAQKGGIVVAAMGKARGSGSLGDTIVVENVASRKRMEAEIIDERMVQVKVE